MTYRKERSMERTKVIFGNAIPACTRSKAERKKKSFIRKYGNDSYKVYHMKASPAPAIGDMLGVSELKLSRRKEVSFNEKSIILGNIRMGFGHYRIAMALASAAHALGYEPYWFDLSSFEGTTCSKLIKGQNRLYSVGSRLSQKSALFNKAVWEKLNCEGFRKLSYNACDQKTAELMTPVFRDIPKDVPFLAAHSWAAQAAVHAGLKKVVNVIPDNWPMALHLAEGALHTVQTPSSYIGYRVLRGMDGERPLQPMPADQIICTGHYIDHELVSNIDEDCKRRIQRTSRRYLLTVGGAGAQRETIASIIRQLLPEVKRRRAVILLNTGDHSDVLHSLVREIPQMKKYLREHIDDFEETKRFAADAYDGEISGIHAFCHSDIFAAVYSTNLLMRVCDVLVTKPGELAFYPVPKLLIKRVGGHEAWGAVRSAEIGDGTYECSSPGEISAVLSLIQNDQGIVKMMCENIRKARDCGIYDGAYNAV